MPGPGNNSQKKDMLYLIEKVVFSISCTDRVFTGFCKGLEICKRENPPLTPHPHSPSSPPPSTPPTPPPTRPKNLCLLMPRHQFPT